MTSQSSQTVRVVPLSEYDALIDLLHFVIGASGMSNQEVRDQAQNWLGEGEAGWLCRIVNGDRAWDLFNG